MVTNLWELHKILFYINFVIPHTIIHFNLFFFNASVYPYIYGFYSNLNQQFMYNYKKNSLLLNQVSKIVWGLGLPLNERDGVDQYIRGQEPWSMKRISVGEFQFCRILFQLSCAERFNWFVYVSLIQRLSSLLKQFEKQPRPPFLIVWHIY